MQDIDYRAHSDSYFFFFQFTLYYVAVFLERVCSDGATTTPGRINVLVRLTDVLAGRKTEWASWNRTDILSNCLASYADLQAIVRKLSKYLNVGA